MPIANAVQRSSTVYVYNERGGLLFTTSVGSGPNDELTGYTASAVSVRRSNTIYTYNEKGSLLATTSAR